MNAGLSGVIILVRAALRKTLTINVWPMGNDVERKLLLKMIVMMTVVDQSFQVNTGLISTTSSPE